MKFLSSFDYNIESKTVIVIWMSFSLLCNRFTVIVASRDKAADQLADYRKDHGSDQGELTNSGGNPIADKLNLLTVGPRGPALLQDVQFLDEMAHFNRERIPERVVHAKGAAAFGYFKVTHDISQYSRASLFSQIGKMTPIVIRFSTVVGESGSSDTVRDPRGFAVKFYTDEGNWDMTGNNTPIFFIRDPMQFPSFIHTMKRNPVTHLKDPDALWDFATLMPESVHQFSILFSDRGIPDGFRFMNGYGSHTFKLVNKDGKAVYCKFHFKTDQGIRNLTPERAAQLASEDPDYSIRDLYVSIAEGNFPSWTLSVQIMTFEQAEIHKFNPFDLTKVWSHCDFPLIPVGKLVLDRNPKNYFSDVEQLAFNPSHMPPGIEPSPDKMLHGRLFAYDDTHRHRLGTNYLQLPVNCPYRTQVHNYQRDGAMTYVEQSTGPNYYPNSFDGLESSRAYTAHRYNVSADVARFNSDDEDNFTQANDLWSNVLNATERAHLAENIAEHLSNAQEFLQERAVAMFTEVNVDYGYMVKENLMRFKAMSSTLHRFGY